MSINIEAFIPAIESPVEEASGVAAFLGRQLKLTGIGGSAFFGLDSGPKEMLTLISTASFMMERTGEDKQYSVEELQALARDIGIPTK